MKQFGGDALFLENGNISSGSIPSSHGKVIISQGNISSDAENAVKVLEEKGIFTVIAPAFDKTLKENMTQNEILAVELDKKSLAEIFKNFSDKDSEVKIVKNDDDTVKVKFYAGSLSKSYQFTPDENQKKLLNDK